MVEWTNYAVSLAKQLGLRGAKHSKPFGQNFTESDLDKFSGEQIYQLEELYNATLPTSDKKETDKT